LRTVATFAKPEEAHNLRAFLEGNGIQAFVRDENTGASYSTAIGGIRVEVGDADFERSVALRLSEPYAGDLSSEAVSAANFPQKTQTPDNVYSLMNAIDRELPVFRAIVKAFGVYQLIYGAERIIYVLMEKAGIVHVPIGSSTREGEYVAWAIFHFCAALILLYCTDSFCRMAFSPQTLSGSSNETFNPSPAPKPLSAALPAGKDQR
jgi:hypothetical protein